MMGRIPAVTDYFESENWRFEVMDMDKNRVDKVLVASVAGARQDESQAQS
jgi:putative hemolysin